MLKPSIINGLPVAAWEPMVCLFGVLRLDKTLSSEGPLPFTRYDTYTFVAVVF